MYRTDVSRPRPVAVRRALGVLALLPAFALFAAVAGAQTAHAASDLGPDADRYVSEVTGIQPTVQGVDVSVGDGGTSVTLHSSSRQTIIVLGYGKEPYLRFTPSGVDENSASVTSGLNGRGVVTPLPASAGGDARKVPAQWVHRSDQPEFTWPDYRVRWASAERPPVVAADPASAHDVFAWGLPITVDGQPAVVTGELRWTGETSIWKVLAIVLLVLFVLMIAAAAGYFLWYRRRAAPPPERPLSPRRSPAQVSQFAVSEAGSWLKAPDERVPEKDAR